MLVVEDEYYIADDVSRSLRDIGAEVVGPVSSLTSAHAALDDGAFDCALIDLNLQGENAAPIADRLKQARKPFAIATGYGSSTIPDRLKATPRIEKPFDLPKLLRLIRDITVAKST